MVKPVPGQRNLKWAQETLRAKAGLSSKMAIPKKIAQKSRAKLKRANGTNQGTATDSVLQAKLQALVAERARRQRHHLVKQLQQACKKARTFLVRRVMRKAKEEASSEAALDDVKLRALRAVSPAAVVRRALQPLGLAGEVELRDDPDEASGEADVTDQELCVQWEKRLLGSRAVQEQLGKLRAHEDKVEETQQQQQQQQQRRHESQGNQETTEVDEMGQPARKRKRAAEAGETKTPTAPKAKAGKAAAKAASKSGGDALGSRFIGSLMADADDAEGSVDGSDEGGGFTLASNRDAGTYSGKSRAASGKAKNVISRSGNRMGQRQRQKLLAQKQGKEVDGKGAGGKGAGGKGDGGRKGGGKGRGADGRGRSGVGRGGGASRGHGGWQEPGVSRTASGHATAEKLHPSWEAKKTPEGAIQAYQGKKVVFD